MNDSIAATTTTPHFEIPGPSAMGTDRRRFWSLLRLTSRMEFQLRYHGSILGYAWTLVHPLLLFVVLYVFFAHVIRFGQSIESYAVLLLFNIMMFTFFARAAGASVTSLVSRERMLRTTGFPRIIIPISVVVTAGLGLLLGMPVVFAFMLGSGVEPMLTWLFLPVILVLLLALTGGVALLLSTLYVTLRDISQIWEVASRALFYASPVVYPIERVPEAWREVAFANPMVPILTQARHWMIDPSAPSAVEAGGSLGMALSTTVFVLILGAGFWLFVRRANRIAELL